MVTLLFALKIEIADAEGAGAVVDPEHAAFLLVAGGDEAIFAGLLLRRALAAAVAARDAERPGSDLGAAGIVSELTGHDVARQLVESIDQG